MKLDKKGLLEMVLLKEQLIIVMLVYQSECLDGIDKAPKAVIRTRVCV